MTETNRKIFAITGADATGFLQNLVTNDVARPGLSYHALLTPQGKYLADFFLLNRAGGYLLDVDADLADGLISRLNMYRLRADVTIAPAPERLSLGLNGDPQPENSFADPRHPDLGWRAYGNTATTADINWTEKRITLGVPQSGIELTPDTYILEAGFERLAGVDFKKGCYVGQEITARMKHKTELKKGLVRVALPQEVPVGTELTNNGKPAGTLYSQSGGYGLAHVRFDRARSPMQADGVTVTLEEIL